jgi:hypothetical protein
MIELKTQLNEALYEQVAAIASQANLSLDQMVEIALSAQVQAWSERQYLQDRAQKGSWEDFQAILAQVPNQPPSAFDQL